MNWANIILTSFSLAIDAMSVNVANGINEKNIKISKMILISLTFGIFQFVMPLIGYAIGLSFKQYVEKAIPWIAFGLLTLLAIKSFIEWLKDRKTLPEEKEEKKITFLTILVQGVATSIDALCIGFVYLSYSIGEALIVFAIIGVVTFTLSFLAILFANKLEKYLKNFAGLIAAIVFLAVGIKILLEGIL